MCNGSWLSSAFYHTPPDRSQEGLKLSVSEMSDRQNKVWLKSADASWRTAVKLVWWLDMRQTLKLPAYRVSATKYSTPTFNRQSRSGKASSARWEAPAAHFKCTRVPTVNSRRQKTAPVCTHFLRKNQCGIIAHNYLHETHLLIWHFQTFPIFCGF